MGGNIDRCAVRVKVDEGGDGLSEKPGFPGGSGSGC